jgi:hypothetical protein
LFFHYFSTQCFHYRVLCHFSSITRTVGKIHFLRINIGSWPHLPRLSSTLYSTLNDFCICYDINC